METNSMKDDHISQGGDIMGYKSPAIHSKVYSTDCKCRSRLFAGYLEAVKHCVSCSDATAVYYKSAYAAPLKVYDKVAGQC